MRLSTEITYPVFMLNPFEEIKREHGRVSIVNHTGEYIVDDTRKEGKFAIRRMWIAEDIKVRKEKKYEYMPLLKLGKAVKTEEQLIVALTKQRSFVDSTGRIFTHAPTTYYFIEYFKVLRAVNLPSRTLLFIEGMNTPIEVNRSPGPGNLYAGVLNLKGRKILYELSRTKKKRTRRKL